MKGVKALSKIGIGTKNFTIPDHGPHKSSLMASLTSDINVIDTSTTYGDGESETLIGNTLKDYDTNIEGSDFPKFNRSNIYIISKYGYSVGESLETNYPTKEARKKFHMKPYPESEDMFYSFHPDFLERELTKSLERLQTPYLDSYLVEDPETILTDEIPLDTPPKEMPKYREKAVDKLYEKLSQAFEGLEKEVKKGRIRSYGVSSNGFSYPLEDPYFMPYTELVNIAKKASETVHGKGKAHSFQCVQFPGNILERNGINNVAPWAKEHNISVLVGRPLTAYDANGEWRLASYPKQSIYLSQYEKCLAFFSKNPTVSALLREMDAEKTNYASFELYNENLNNKLLPTLLENVPETDENEKAWISLTAFILTYEDEVKHWTSLRSEQYIEGLNIGFRKGSSLQKFALKFLLDNPNIDCVINGITEQTYLEDALPLLSPNKQ